VVIVDHGSRKAEANAELEEFASLYRCVCVFVRERERERERETEREREREREFP
jgi:hypothetical protein